MYFSFHLVSLFAGVINLLLAGFVLFINPRRRLNRVYFAVGLALACWNLCGYILTQAESVEGATLAIRAMLMGVIFIPPLLFHLAVETTCSAKRSFTVLFAYPIAFAFAALNMSGYFIEGVRPYYGSYRAVWGPAFGLFCGVFFPLTTWGTISRLVNFIRASHTVAARPARFLLFGVSLLAVGGLHDMVTVFGWDRYPGTRIPIITWANVGASLYGLIIGYSILSDQLFDVRISISRHAATALRLSFLGGIAYILMVSVGIMFRGIFTVQGLFAALSVLLVSAVITANVFPKLFSRLGNRLEQQVLGDHFEYQDKVTAFIYSPQESDTLQKLLDDATDLVLQQLTLSSAGVAVLNGDSKTRGQSLRTSEGMPSWEKLLVQDSALIRFFRTSGVQVLHTKNDTVFGHNERVIRALMVDASAELALSIGSRSKDPLGIMVIGPRRDGRPLSKSDVELLHALCRSLVFRIERIAIVQNEQLRQAISAKDRFLASINHEIRNPLNGITGIAQMLSESHTDPKSVYLIKTLKACTEQLRSSMDDVLDFTQIESDAVTVTTSAVNLTELIRTTCAGNDVSGKELVFAQTNSADIFVQCDSGKVRQIVSNYVANALKYGTPPGAEVTLVVDETIPGTCRVTINVTSTGPTLSKEEVGVLFTALTRGRRARETNAHGTGLGLALCKKLAQAMGGNVGVNSSDGKTTFCFEASFLSIPTNSPTKIEYSTRYNGRRALAVEDEPYNRHVLEFYLKRFGISAIWAEDGQSALAAAQNETFDLILMDWLLPDMDGAELLQKIRSGRSNALPPVIVLSAYSTTNKKAECLAAGAVAFISKPIDPEKLSGALEVCKFGPLAAPL